MELFRRLSFAMVLLTLVGCGGGDGGLSNGGNPDPGDGDDNNLTISLALSSDTVSEQNPVTITATVMDGSNAVANKLVSFLVSDSSLAYLSPENGAATTNSEGIVEIQLLVGTKSGGGTITASIDSETVTNTIAFNSAGDGEVIVEGPEVADITLIANAQQLASSGAQEVLLTAIAKDGNNNLVKDATLAFSSDSGQIQVTNAVTGDNGQASAILRTQGNPENRTIKVTAIKGTVSDDIDVFVVGTNVQLTGSSSLALGDVNTFIINVVNSDSEGIAGAEVALSLSGQASEAGGEVADITIPDSVITDASGQATVSIVGNSGGSNSIVASTLGATTTKSVSVQADSFTFTSFNDGNGTIINPSSAITLPDVLLSDTATVTLTWNRSNTPVADGTVVEFTTTRGTLPSNQGVITNGTVSVTVNSSDAGDAIVTFTGTDGDVVLSNSLEFEFVAESVDTVIAQASPSSIGPSGQTSTISVIVKDANGNLVKNKVIDFNLSDTTGGSIFPASAVTDSSGNASTVYTSNAVSAQDDVAITATVRDQQDKSDTVTLTVADRELFIALGTGNEIQDNVTTYTKQFIAFVTDADGNPVVGQKLTISSVPEGYYKGQWVRIYDGDEFIRWETRGEVATNGTHYCTNEDVNRDGILDPGEDTNNNGFLTPGNVVASLLTVSVENDNTVVVEAITDDEGKVNIDLVYAQSYGNWVDINLIVSGKVSGTESSVKTTYSLPVSGEDVSNEDVAPPMSNVSNWGPFGLRANCSVPD
ncbi:hypothetical protein HII17_18300 [Thalassotalea sp. M1531]|uniref:Big-1 domain-containing protein n=1 Tax=Thalassotalea algicola TaxID=2716224 RepID=A0A7Y0LFR2_9GAMM|nr:Ig-like domain-containing protein [Thalassotalea algicola]NMP33503.1 hypothetical protein [Thalassotalea algicola]